MCSIRASAERRARVAGDTAPRPEARWRMRILDAADIAALQRFFDANPAYFLTTQGEPPRPDEAEIEFDDVPPAGMAYRATWRLGFFDDGGVLVGMATIVADLVAAQVWHVGLFIVATALHGSGAAATLYRALEAWMVDQGAHWIRLGVVRGNTRAERFWERQGYVDVRERGPLQMGQKSNLLRVMFKPLAGGTLAEYLALVARDCPGAA
jgi:GNAT superfamily N-acetyltransferase